MYQRNRRRRNTNQSGILFPIEGEVSELEQEMIDMIKTDGKHKDYELIEYVNDVNREHTEVLMELNINGIMDTAYSYGNERLTVERFDGWTGFYTYDPRGSVSGVTGMEGYIWQSYRYDAYGNITFGKPQYNNVYGYNAESYNPNVDAIYLRARYYNPTTADFMTEDSYLGDISDPLTLNRYSYVKASPLNYIDPSGHSLSELGVSPDEFYPNSDERERMGIYYQHWKAEYDRARTDEQKWRLIDIKESLLPVADKGATAGNLWNKAVQEASSWLEETGGEISLYQSGDIEVKVYMADLLSETDLCEAGKTAASFLMGYKMEDSKYLLNLSGGLDVTRVGILTAYALEYTGVEDYVAEHFADTDAYYLGKVVASLAHELASRPIADTTDSILDALTNAGASSEDIEMGDNSWIVWVGGTALSILTKTGTNSAPGAAYATGGLAATAGEAAVAGVGIQAAVVAGGAVILVAAGNADHAASKENLDKNAEKYNESKGDSNTRGQLTGKLDGLTSDERQMVENLLESGKDVEIIPRSSVQGEKTPDFLVNGVKTELKTLNGTSLNTPVKRITEGFEQGASTVIVDGRKTGITMQDAETIVNRVIGKLGELPGSVEIWTNEGIFVR